MISMHCDGWKTGVRETSQHVAICEAARLCAVWQMLIYLISAFFFLWGSFPRQTNESIIINILFSEQSLSHFYKWKNQGMGRLHG